MDWQKPKSLAKIKDGTSNTLMVGEDIWNQTRATCSDPCYGLGFAWAHPVEANATAAIPLNARRPFAIPYAENDWMGHNGFRSWHPGGGQFGQCDGSVRFVSNTIALGVYRAAATIRGGEAVALPD
jgi:prepilin-type processing-associated H-X9-DG protein